MDQPQNQLTDEQFDLIQQIGEDITAQPDTYRAAGQWLDHRFSYSQCLARLEEDLGGRERNWQTDLYNQVLRTLADREETLSVLLDKRGRVIAAMHYFLHRLKKIIPREDAARICLLTAIVCYPDVAHVGQPLTEFLHDWQWSDED